jgi:flagellin
MSLSINNNTLSLQAQRQLSEHTADASRMIAKLSSGLRITGASDDPAGQAISSRISSQLRGMSQVMRNLNDGTSMLQVADNAMANIGDSLQRLRELAVASGNASYTDQDRTTLQRETNQLLAQITQVGNETAFNGAKVFAQDDSSIGGDSRKRTVLDGLKTGWLGAAEELVKKYYGLEGDGVTLQVNLDTTDGASGELASVVGSTAAGATLTLNLDMADFGTAATPDGGSGPLYSDRIIAHEMVHAIMLRSTSFDASKWFTEGTAELIPGADDRLAGALASSSATAIVNSISKGKTAASFTYEGAYVASRYLHARLNDMGVEGGIKGIMGYMNENRSASLDQALNAVSGGVYTDEDSFLMDFHANGAKFIATRMDLKNADTGAIGGLDADGGLSRSAREVVQDVASTPSDKPLQHFKVEMPEIGGNTGVRRVQIQAGAGASKDDLIELQFSAMSARALGLADLDMHNTGVALLHIDQAIDFVDKQRVAVGASSNRLDMVAQNTQTASANLHASQSRIQDVGYADSTARLTRAQILQQAASAMLTQANGQPSAVLALLR